MKATTSQHILLCLLFLLSLKPAFSQYYVSGQEPFGIRWKQINTEHFRIVFPSGHEQQAQETANILETTYKPVYLPLQSPPRKTSLLLHDYSATSNAFAGLAPFRMEFYNVPPQDSYAQPWNKQLALHEFRHIVQFRALDKGFTRGISWFFGQQGIAAVLGLYIPFWFLEGDAISSETALSSSGRGREPGFEMILRAQILEKGRYSYDKAVFRSYRDMVPNQYELGYFLVAQARKEYGPEIWRSALNTVARKPFMITPFSRGIRKVSGLKKIPFYKQILDSLEAGWKKQLGQTHVEPVEKISQDQRYFTEFTHPQVDSQGNIYALRTGIDDIPRIIRIDPSGKEEVVFTPGRIYQETLSYGNGKLCWSEKETHPRWDNVEYAVIKVFDVETGKIRKFTSRSRYFAPAISPDGSMIAAVEVKANNNYSITILDIQTGKPLNNIVFQDDVFPMTPAWAEDNKTLAAIILGDKGKSLVLADAENGKTKTIIPFTYKEISHPVFSGNEILFTGSFSGINNIYKVVMGSGNISRITSVPFGCDFVCYDESTDRIIFSNYDSKGYHLTGMPVKEGTPFNKVQDHSIKLYESIVQQNNFNLDTTSIPDSTYGVKKFRRFPHLFDFHSWAPVSIQANNREVQPGVSVLSQNLLSTSVFEAGYSWNINEEEGKFYMNYSYLGFFPVIDISADYGKRKDVFTDRSGKSLNYSWQETNIGTAVRLPLDFTRSKYYKGLQPFASYSLKFRDMNNNSPLRFRKSNISSLGFGLYLYHNLKRSQRQLMPRWGQTLNVRYYYTPFDDKISSVLGITGTLYFPGLLRNHGISVSGSYQEMKSGYYAYSDIILFPRGYSNLSFDEVFSARTGYAFPLFYPDFSLRPVMYLQRVKMKLFYDWAQGSNNNKTSTISSLGAELTGDMHLLRFLAPIELGVRGIYIPEKEDYQFELMFAVNFDTFYLNGRDWER